MKKIRLAKQTERFKRTAHQEVLCNFFRGFFIPRYGGIMDSYPSYISTSYLLKKISLFILFFHGKCVELSNRAQGFTKNNSFPLRR